MPPRKRAPESSGRHAAESDPGKAVAKSQHLGGAKAFIPGYGEEDARRPQAKGRRPGPAHAAPEAREDKGPLTRAMRAKTEHMPVVTKPEPKRTGGTVHASASRRVHARRATATRRAGEAANAYANRAAFRSMSGGKPSVAGRTVAGAAAGGATGLAVGGPVGAGVGAAIGGVGGAVGGAKAKKAYKQAMAVDPVSRKIIVVEFVVCAVVLALSPLTDKHKSDTGGQFAKRATALMALFFILAIVAGTGRIGAKAAAGLGGLVTVTLLLSQRDLFVVLANGFSGGTADAGIAGSVGGAAVGGIVGSAPADENNFTPDQVA